MKLSYLNIANQAAESEREGDYLKAAQLWDKAKGLTKSESIRQWAEYRVEHNILRNSLISRAIENEELQKERNKKAREKIRIKKEAELLKVNINKTSEVGCE